VVKKSAGRVLGAFEMQRALAPWSGHHASNVVVKSNDDKGGDTMEALLLYTFDE
jgi:hypothetical protein